MKGGWEMEVKRVVESAYSIIVKNDLVVKAIEMYLVSMCKFQGGANVKEISSEYGHGEEDWVVVEFDFRSPFFGNDPVQSKISMRKDKFAVFAEQAIMHYLKDSLPNLKMEKFFPSIGEYTMRAEIYE